MHKNFEIKTSSKFPEGHIIDEVPYISQETSFYCSYACSTMILNYYERNTNLKEVLFNSGIGYSLIYPAPIIQKFPAGGTLTSQWPLDRQYLAKLFGLSYEIWSPQNMDGSIHNNWDKYWKKIKEYIKDNIPVETTLNLFILPSAKKLLKNHSWLDWEKIPRFFWSLMPVSHNIVIVGFDEEKNLVYYNDPCSELLSGRNEGIYASAPISLFAKAVSKTQLGEILPRFIVSKYKKIREPDSENIRLEKSHKRNIDKIKGETSSYDQKWRSKHLGINATNEFKKNFKITSEKERDRLTAFYKSNALKFKFFIKFCNFCAEGLNSVLCEKYLIDIFHRISLEKLNTWNYVNTNPEITKSIDYEAKLLKSESEKWEELSRYFLIFVKKGLTMKNSRAFKIFNDMDIIVSDIIEIQNSIIKNK